MSRVLSPLTDNNETFNVLAYGAKADNGTTDNSPAFNACFAAAGTYAATNGGAVVVIPPGKYKVVAPVTQKPGCTYYAYGAYVFNGDAFDTANWHMFNIGAGTGYTGDSQITWLGGTFDAKGQNCPVGDNNAKNIFLIGQGYNYRFEDVTCRNVANWHAIDSGAINGLIVNRCRFEGWVDKTAGQINGGKEAIQIQEGTDETTEKNILITNNYMGPAIDGSGLSAHPIFCGSHTMPTGTTFHNFVIANNIVEQAQFAALAFYGLAEATIADNVLNSTGSWAIWLRTSFNEALNGRRIVISGNTINGFANTGIYVQPDNTNNGTSQQYSACIISNNAIAPGSATGSGITARFLRDSVISNNVLDGMSGVGIFLDDECNRCLVTGNKILNTGSHGIQLDLTDDCEISGNHIYATGGNGIFIGNNSTGNVVSGNTFKGTGTTNNTWAGVRISNTGNNNTSIIGNQFRKWGGTFNPTNPIIIDGSTPTGTVFSGNDFGTGWNAADIANYTFNGATCRILDTMYARATSTTSIGTSATTVTGAQATVPLGNWNFEFFVPIQHTSGTPTGWSATVQGPTSSNIVYLIERVQTTTLGANTFQAFGSASGTTTPAAPTMVRVVGSMTVTTAGTLSIQMTRTGGTTSVSGVGAYLKLQQVS